jgi:hypothetical protein
LSSDWKDYTPFGLRPLTWATLEARVVLEQRPKGEAEAHARSACDAGGAAEGEADSNARSALDAGGAAEGEAEANAGSVYGSAWESTLLAEPQAEGARLTPGRFANGRASAAMAEAPGSRTQPARNCG